jgi:1,4-alpha-glucan branching enzyme
MKGYLAIILHSHLPYVKHPEDRNALEQRWLFEAITESYIPLLNVVRGLCQDGVRCKITLSLTPPLLEMLADPAMQQLYVKHLDRQLELADKEVTRLAFDRSFQRIAEMYRWKLREAHHLFVEEYNGCLITGFKHLAQAGYLHLLSSAATHAYLPLIQTKTALNAQVALGVEAFEHHLGFKPDGFWLPECGYKPGIDEVLAQNGIRFFIVDSHALWHADPAPRMGVYGPVRTPAGVLAFARDKESAKQVWSSKEGYPGDHVYREYYRDIGWDLDWDYIKPYVHPDGIRVNTGFKYYRVTGEGAHKEPYVMEWAEARAAEHAEHFLHARQEQAERLHYELGEKPIIVSPYDTELFGHWWYEGPAFLNYLCRKAYYDQDCLSLISPMEYPGIKSTISADLPESSWGNEGYNAVWLNEKNSWVYRHLHAAEERMLALVDSYPHPTAIVQRGLKQAARELMLAQSSDWTFILTSGSTTNYAYRRLQGHLGWFFRLADQLQQGTLDEGLVAYLEQMHGIFPYISHRLYEPPQEAPRLPVYPKDALRVLLLSWEYPPVTVGGLGRHVYELSQGMAHRGIEVHVITAGAPGSPQFAIVNGVCVHRTAADVLPGDSFMDWVFQMNVSMVELARKLFLRRRFNLVHTHDWLSGEAGRILSLRHHVPLLATIHATEHGRNNGIHNDVQRAIDHVERELLAAADDVIVCSKAMHNELTSVFNMPDALLHVIPNGVDIKTLEYKPDSCRAKLPEHGRVIAFLGRFVREKGVQILLEAAAQVMWSHPDVQLVCGGRGPLQQDLVDRARELGLTDRVHFPGFLSDHDRNALLARATVAVFPSLYEPFGIVALEAMGSSTPTIVTDTGGLAEIVEDGIDGIKVQPGDVQGLVQAINRVLDHPDWATRLAWQGKEKTMNQYTWDVVVDKTLTLYNKMDAEYKCKASLAVAP